jgi:hypothetical protein
MQMITQPKKKVETLRLEIELLVGMYVFSFDGEDLYIHDRDDENRVLFSIDTSQHDLDMILEGIAEARNRFDRAMDEAGGENV